jgi:hypothetical protein
MQINDAGGVKKLLFNWGFARKLFYIKRGLAHDKVRGAAGLLLLLLGPLPEQPPFGCLEPTCLCASLCLFL